MRVKVCYTGVNYGRPEDLYVNVRRVDYTDRHDASRAHKVTFKSGMIQWLPEDCRISVLPNYSIKRKKK